MMRALPLTLLAAAMSQAVQASLLGLPVPPSIPALPSMPASAVPAPAIPSNLAVLGAVTTALTGGLAQVPTVNPGAVSAAGAIVAGTLQGGLASGGDIALGKVASETDKGLNVLITQSRSGFNEGAAIAGSFGAAQQGIMAGALQMTGSGFSSSLAPLTSALNNATGNRSDTGVITQDIAAVLNAVGKSAGGQNIAAPLAQDAASLNQILSGKLDEVAGLVSVATSRLHHDVVAMQQDPTSLSTTVPETVMALGEGAGGILLGTLGDLQAGIDGGNTIALFSSLQQSPANLSEVGNSLNRDVQKSLANFGMSTPSFFFDNGVNTSSLGTFADVASGNPQALTELGNNGNRDFQNSLHHYGAATPSIKLN